MVTFVDQHRALEDHHLLAMLVKPLSFHRDDSLRRSALGLPLGEHFRFGVKGVTDEHWPSSFYIVPSQVSHYFRTYTVNTHTGQNGNGERAIQNRANRGDSPTP